MYANVGDQIRAAGMESAAPAKVRAGVAGAGLMGYWHAHALERSGGKVAAVADFNIEKAKHLATKFPNAKAFNGVEEMLASQRLDVLHVCSPTDSHLAIAETATRAGVNLLVEKPVAATANETLRLYELAAEFNTLICPVHQFVFQDGPADGVRLLSQIGELVHLEATICSAGGVGLGDEKLDLTAIDILPHPLSLMQKFLPAGISGVEWNVSRPAAGELRISGSMEKASLSICVSMNSRPTVNSFNAYGTNGTLHFDLFHGFTTLEPGGASKTKKLLRPFDLAMRSFSAATLNLAKRTLKREAAYPGLRRLITEFYAAVSLGTESPISPRQAVEIAEIRDEVIRRTGISKSKHRSKQI